MAIYCVIGARGGSQGIPGKNIRPLLGKPLIAWSIEHALAVPEIDHVLVSTDSPDIARVAREHGADVPFTRPDSLAGSTVGKFDVWKHALEACEAHYGDPCDIYLDLDCTNPLREPSDIQRLLAQFLQARGRGVDAVFTICEARKNPYFNLVEPDGQGALRMSKKLGPTVVRRQDAPRVYEHVASIYALDPAFIRRAGHLLDGHAEGYDIGQDKCFDVDSEFDFELIEFLLTRRARASRVPPVQGLA
jgi:CMP-N,N'-diacetyllegionaminic acid synthase